MIKPFFQRANNSSILLWGGRIWLNGPIHLPLPSLIWKARVKRSRGKMKKTWSHKTGRIEKKRRHQNTPKLILNIGDKLSSKVWFQRCGAFCPLLRDGHLRNSRRGVLGVGIASNKYLARHQVVDIVHSARNTPFYSGMAYSSNRFKWSIRNSDSTVSTHTPTFPSLIHYAFLVA